MKQFVINRKESRLFALTTLSKEESETLIKEIGCLEIKVPQRAGFFFFLEVIISRKEWNNSVQYQALCEGLTESLKTQSKSFSEHLKHSCLLQYRFTYHQSNVKVASVELT